MTRTATTFKIDDIIVPIGGGIDDYDDLQDKPQIEGVTLGGNKTFDDLGLQPITNSEIEALE